MDIDKRIDLLLNRKNGNRFRKHKHKQFWLMLGLSIVTFILGTMLVLPIYDDRRGIDILLSYFGGDGDAIVVGDNSSEPEAYNYWYAPANSFGIQETKTVNWSYFKELFNNHFYKKALYKRYEYSDWTDGTQYLTLNKTWNDSGFWKVNIILDVPVDLYSVNISFGCDLPVLNYIEREGHEIWLNYTANTTETYQIMFNWSDIAQIPNLEISKHRTDGKFWISFKRDNVPAGHYEFDPTFGLIGGADTGDASLESAMQGSWGEAVDGNGNADNITVQVVIQVSYSGKMICGLYEYVDFASDYAGILIAQTEERTITVDGTRYETFNFSDPKPSISDNTKYYLVAHAETQAGGLAIKRKAEVGYGVFEAAAYSSSMENPWTGESPSTSRRVIYCSYTVGVVNAAPTQTGESPTNHSTGIAVTPDLYVICNDADAGDTMNATWSSNSSGTWYDFATNVSISPGTNITQNNPNFSAYSTKYWWKVNLTDGTDWKNITYDFTTGTDAVTITLLSYSPANIRTNSSEPSWFIYNITTGGTPINFWSIVWAYGVNHTQISSHNTSYSLEDPLAVNKLRGYSRNENNTQETKFNSTTGDGSIGDFGEWNTHDMNGGMITVDASGTNWTRVNSTEEETEHLFAHITFVDEEEIRKEQKSGNEIDVTGANFVKVEFNMTDTDWWNSSHYNNTLYKFHFFANETNANKPLSVYYVNSSYTTGDVSSSPYAALIGAIQPGDPYHISEDNSSYYEIVFSSTEAGFVGAVNMTEKFYIIFTGRGAAPKRWWIHYADNNDSHIVDGDTHYHDFDNRTIIEVSGNGGNSWTANASTPDVYLDFISLNEEDKVEVKLYANDTSGNEAWSSTHQDLVDITNYPPNTPGVILPNGEPPTDLYEVGEIINITYNWIGDPNHETCWVNITAHTGTTEDIAYYIQNRSITDAETHINTTWWYDWDTTGINTGTYHINITATDPFNEQAWGEQNGTFDLITWQELFSGYITGGNVTDYVELFSGWITGGNATINWNEIFSGYITGGNITFPSELFSGYITGGNITDYRELFSGWITGGNTSVRAWQELFSGYITGGNITDYTELFSGWISGGNITGYVELFSGWITGGNTTPPIVFNITITNEYPANGSTNIPVNTSIHFLVNNTLGHLMNITVYTGSNLTNCSAYLGSFNSVGNGTYYLGYHNASEVSTEYAWRVNVTDAYGNYANETYNFTTASSIGAIYVIGGMGGYGLAMVIAFSLAFTMLFLVVILVWKRKRKRMG